MDRLVNLVIPILARSTEPTFNVFDVMHHGLHEKQMSNVFRWLLDPAGTHGLGDRFVSVFLDALGATDLPPGPYVVRQEVNTSGPFEDAADIADLVLDHREARVVIENYYTSDGHGHDYARYLRYASEADRTGVVVLLCQREDLIRRTDGWEHASVVTYDTLVAALYREVVADAHFRQESPLVFGFLTQMYDKFVKGEGFVSDRDIVNFVVAMCGSGEARRYGQADRAAGIAQLGSDLAARASETFASSYEVLHQVKETLSTYASLRLVPQLEQSLGQGRVTRRARSMQGIYRWTINFDVEGESGGRGESPLQIKFGPSAWEAIEADPEWHDADRPSNPDYRHLFVARSGAGVIRQSAVTIEDVLRGLEPEDLRLGHELLDLLGRSHA